MMKEKGIIFTSFKTPFGFDENGNIEGFPYLGGQGTKAVVPVLGGDPYNIVNLRGNCIKAFDAGQILKFPAPFGPVPFCTGLWVPGLAEGIVGIRSVIGSNQVDAKISATGDVAPNTFGTKGTFGCDEFAPDTDNPIWRNMSYCAYSNTDTEVNGNLPFNVTRTINVDNHDASTDDATFSIKDFSYNVDWITTGDFLVNFEDPAKSFLPSDIHQIRINMFTKNLPLFDIPQHPRVTGLEDADIRVFNYAVKVSDLDGDGPINQPNGTKPIKAENFTQPGFLSFEERSYANVTYQNIGNSLDKIQNLTISFPDLHALNIDPGLDESWMSEVNQTEIASIFFVQESGIVDQLNIAIKPARHWTTTPSFADNGDLQAGLYKVRVEASSVNATAHDMANKDPLDNFLTRLAFSCILCEF